MPEAAETEGAARERAAAEAAHALPPCGIVMKGGITSGVVYPKAAEAVSRTFRFRQVGGTSAGAIAAAATAAAEYRRQTTGERYAFDRLATLPEELGAPSRLNPDRSKLSSLFQPQQGTRPLFAVLLASLDALNATPGRSAAPRQGFWRRAAPVMAAAQREFAGGVRAGRRYAWYVFFGLGVAFAPALACLIAVLLGAVGGASPGWRLAAGFGALLLVAAVIAPTLLARHFGGLFGAGRALVGSALGDVAANGYGLCSGHDGSAPDDPEGGEPPLTRWLYDYLQDLAGLPADAPLTFGMLKGQGIDLEMVSTCLTLARPYRLPDFSGSPGTFSWRPDDFAALFPPAVVAWMADPARSQPAASDAAVRSLPDPDDLPVIVAVRMSLSFPVLFSAIPLWSRDFRAVPAGLPSAERVKVVESLPYEPCWFSDGGLTSNFPMQLFDDPLPSWPVFGLNLRDYHPAFPDVDVTVARTNADEYQPWFTRWETTAGATTSLTGFLGAVWNAAQNWSDNLQLTLPGFRERIAHIHLRPTEGGLNLNMPPDVIAAISDKGARAASALGDRFDPDRATAVGPAGKSEVTWDNHRWWRFRAVFASVQPFLRDLASHLRRTGRSDDFHSLLGAASDEPPHAMSYDWPSKKQRAAAIAAADRVDAVVSAWEQAKVDYETDSPRPTAGVRIAPRV